MIIGDIHAWRNMQLDGEVWEKAFEALQGLRPDSAEEKIQLIEDKLYMIVMSYATKTPDNETAVLEAHRRFVDIQTVITGSERIDWFAQEVLDIKTPYDAEKDVEFYHRPGTAPGGIDVTPGRFVVLFPEDAHMPGLVSGLGDAQVKKAVIKLDLGLL